jgi:hypothetical protein
MIEPARLDKIVAVVERAGLNAQTLSALREALPDIHLTHCMDGDIGAAAAPVRERDGFRVYLVDGSGHCMKFTGDLDAATGLVLAERDPDDEDDN